MGGLFIAAAVAVTLDAVLQSATGFGFAFVAAPLMFPTLGSQKAMERCSRLPASAAF